MKKLLSVVLALCLVCSTVFMFACGAKEKTAKELVESACQKFENVDAFDASLDYDIKMNMQGMTMTMPITAEIKTVGANTDNPVSDVKMTMEFMGQKMDLRIYMEDGWAYYDMLGTQYKSSLTAAEQEYANMVNGLVAQADYDYLEAAELIENSDGTVSVAIELDETLANEIGKAAAGLMSSAGNDGDIKINNVKYEYVIDKNESLVKLNVVFDMDMTLEGMAVKADMTAHLVFKAFGKDVTITAPEGYLNYQEMSVK